MFFERHKTLWKITVRHSLEKATSNLKIEVLKSYQVDDYSFVVFQIAEFDSPGVLMANPNSVFSKLVQATELEAENHYLIE